METYFSTFRKGILGQEHHIKTPYHEAIPLVYADWTASGRMYQPIETRLQDGIFPFVANTHTETNYTGSKMTQAYYKARQIIKEHLGATSEDILISSGSGMTDVINKFQRILGLKLHESFKHNIRINQSERPVVFVTHMEHHSNQTSWIETIADVVVVPAGKNGLVSVNNFRNKVYQHRHRKHKIAAITSCSNVTGIMTPYMQIAQLMHEYEGLCFVDFACSAPYIDIDMNPTSNDIEYLDAIYFSPHKFLGGPGSTGILIFKQELYKNLIPDSIGGGTVEWTNPWGQHKYIDDIEIREDGGTPAFLQTIKVAMCLKLKQEMGTNNIQKREKEILDIIWPALSDIPNLHVLAKEHKNRLPIVSFYIDDLHYNLGVKMLSDRFGIQTRGGCSCAGTYGHYLLNIPQNYSKNITDLIDQGNCSTKPGWIRMSIHPTQSNDEIRYILSSIRQVAKHHKEWKKDYRINQKTGEIRHLNQAQHDNLKEELDDWFSRPICDIKKRISLAKKM